ncbi:MAG: hypothetical protein K2X86_01400 [Cytophagaceae bacterium]|nr:hypothetical protein [Cytophagaceae bacterium]
MKIHFRTLIILCFAALSFITVSAVKAQTYGNEWINSSRTYYKISVAQTGLYAVTFDDLRSAGVPLEPLGTQKGDSLQLFHRGIEQAIYISNDTMFFYGQINDGTLDSLLYDPYSVQPHKYYNLFSDTSAYFLTWSQGVHKRMNLTNVINNSTPDAYHTAEILEVYSDEYELGYKHYISTYLTSGDQGEGWFGSGIYNSTGYTPAEATYVFNPTNVYVSGPNANLELMLVGRNWYANVLNHMVDVIVSSPSNPDLTFSVPAFAFHDTRTFSTSIPIGYLASGPLSIIVRNKGTGFNAPSLISVAYIKINYPQTFEVNGAGTFNFNVLPNVSSIALAIQNPLAGTRIFDITDKNNIKRIVTASLSAGAISAKLNPSAVATKLFGIAPGNYLSIPDIKKVDLTPFNNEAGTDYIIITHTKLMTGSRQYGAYRASAAGGSYDTLVADVTKLYNMFSYGEKSPVAIKRFLTHMFNVGDPKYLFIIGKGIGLDYARNGPYYRKDPNSYINYPDPELRREDFVPTYGVPGSDLMYSMGLNGKPKFIPALATGRLPVKSPAEIDYYLDKINEHEALPNELWRKNLVHLSGGKNASEKINFRNNVDQLKYVVEDTVFGGKVVKTFSKTGTGAVDNQMTGSVVNEVNKGVSYLTFFGHSSPGVIDLDIGFVSDDIYGYNNKGKYPLLLINGCAAAQIFSRYSFAEDWLVTPDRGAIIVVAHTDAGYENQLKNYSMMFYKNAFQKRAMLGKSVGNIQLATITDYESLYGSTNQVDITTLQQMIIIGDPAISMYDPTIPDYETNDNKVSIYSYNNNLVTAVSDSFAISIIVSNLGVDFGDSLQVSVRRIINGAITNFGPAIYKQVKYQDTLLFNIASKDIATYGENIFEITLDPLDSISEISELNNFATLRYFMPLSGVIALMPKEFSIVNNDSVTFIAQSTNLMVGATDYYFEVDTSYLFNSNASVRKSQIINGGSIAKWKNFVLPVLQDSLVYYWRVRYNTIPSGQDTLWGESSFIYINNSPEGWSQSEFPQFFKDQLNGVQRNISQRKWEFAQSSTPVSFRAVGTSYVRNPPNALFPNPGTETVVQVNGEMYQYRFPCANAGILLLAFNQNTGNPYTPYENSDGGTTCGLTGNEIINYFSNMPDSTSGISNPNNQTNLMAYLDSLKQGDYVVLLNSGEGYYSYWSSVLKNKIKAVLGADSLDFLADGMPYILFAQKGNPNPIFEDYGATNEEIVFVDTLVGTYNKGYITSTLIGPAEDWTTLFRHVSYTESPVTDQYELSIIGVDLEGNNIDTVSISQIDALPLSGIVNANQYPFIRLLAEVSDVTNVTPPQLERWQVIYSPVPEGIMNPALAGLSQYNTITRPEGDSISVCYAFENISLRDFTDTLQVKFTITNATSGIKTKLVKLAPLKSDSIVTFCHKFSTRGLVGNNVLQAYVNPKILREQYYNNNIVEMSFGVDKDKINPVLDVVFDGTHIMDGDIVSPSPMITISVYDENRYLIRDSTDGIEVFLQKPGQSVPEKIIIPGSDIISARQVGTNGKNVYQIEYNPKNLPDGIYTLVIKAKDVAGNNSGVQDYRITFEVINAATITNFYPYPNPFSTSTKFVFTLTGSEIPEDLKIQIMTVTGKVVREITKAELGPIHIGNNKTDFSWNGTDEFGDQLANGVYLYRVIIKNAGAYQHRNTAGDKAFKKEFGKMYILR